MPRLPVPGSDQGSWGQILNDYLLQVHEADGTLKPGSVTAATISDGTITETKLASAVQTKLNSGGGGAVTSVNGRTGAVTLTRTDVGLANADNTSDANKPVSVAVQAALNAKANTTHTHIIADVTGLQTALNGKVDAASLTLDSLNDVTASGATDGQSLVFNAGTWGPASVGTGGTVVDATSSVKGVVQLAGDLGGTAAAPTVPGLANKANTTITITGASSLTGGGSLAANRTLSLVNDSATPGNNYYYGTNGSGSKGFYAIPATGDPTVGGDLSGTASNAQIVAAAVGTNELSDDSVTTAKILNLNVTGAKIADNTITEPKLAVSNSPAGGNVLSWNGAALAWAAPAVGGGAVWTYVNATTNYTASSGEFITVDGSAAGFTVTLPAAAAGAYVYVKKTDSSVNGIIIQPASGQIDGTATVVVNQQWEGEYLISNGIQWFRA